MEVHLINTETNELVRTFENVISWGFNFVEYYNGSYRAKLYCDENEHFTNESNKELSLQDPQK